MITQLSILMSSGDTKLTWDHYDEQERENARKEVERLKREGYSFFLVDGTPADEITAGAGTLIVKRLTAEELVAPPGEEEGKDTEQSKKKGRPRKAVAVRPLQGG